MKISQVLSKSLLVAMLLSLISSVAFAEQGYEVTASSAFNSGLKLQEPIEVNMEVSGVKLGSVFFDPEAVQAFLILQNRTPVSVNSTVGISLFDVKGKLLATGIDVSGFRFSGDKIDAGDQKNVKLSFNKFINGFKNVATFQIVLSVGKTKEVATKSVPGSNYTASGSNY